MLTLQEMSDRVEITELAGNWTDAANLRDFDRFQKTWVEDSVWTISEPLPMEVRGAGNVVAKLRELLTYEQFFFQALHVGTIALSGDTARARFGVTEFGRPKTPGQGYFNHAFYADQLRREAGFWRFVRRDYHYMYVDSSMLHGTWYPLPEVTT